jgi:hypothetical protein
MRNVMFRVVEVSEGYFTFQQVGINREPGRAADGSFIVNVVDIPKLLKNSTVGKIVRMQLDVHDLQPVVKWFDLVKAKGKS